MVLHMCKNNNFSHSCIYANFGVAILSKAITAFLLIIFVLFSFDSISSNGSPKNDVGFFHKWCFSREFVKTYTFDPLEGTKRSSNKLSYEHMGYIAKYLSYADISQANTAINKLEDNLEQACLDIDNLVAECPAEHEIYYRISDPTTKPPCMYSKFRVQVVGGAVRNSLLTYNELNKKCTLINGSEDSGNEIYECSSELMTNLVCRNVCEGWKEIDYGKINNPRGYKDTQNSAKDFLSDDDQ